ncbi:unnamed protein product [Amoebophrya sp. A120]|nr:unnamed protein product [Amoebophrya sp. A120]|eukprot:GSA120T00008496001.1
MEIAKKWLRLASDWEEGILLSSEGTARSCLHALAVLNSTTCRGNTAQEDQHQQASPLKQFYDKELYNLRRLVIKTAMEIQLPVIQHQDGLAATKKYVWLVDSTLYKPAGNLIVDVDSFEKPRGIESLNLLPGDEKEFERLRKLYVERLMECIEEDEKIMKTGQPTSNGGGFVGRSDDESGKMHLSEDSNGPASLSPIDDNMGVIGTTSANDKAAGEKPSSFLRDLLSAAHRKRFADRSEYLKNFLDKLTRQLQVFQKPDKTTPLLPLAEQARLSAKQRTELFLQVFMERSGSQDSEEFKKQVFDAGIARDNSSSFSTTTGGAAGVKMKLLPLPEDTTMKTWKIHASMFFKRFMFLIRSSVGEGRLQLFHSPPLLRFIAFVFNGLDFVFPDHDLPKPDSDAELQQEWHLRQAWELFHLLKLEMEADDVPSGYHDRSLPAFFGPWTFKRLFEDKLQLPNPAEKLFYASIRIARRKKQTFLERSLPWDRVHNQKQVKTLRAKFQLQSDWLRLIASDYLPDYVLEMEERKRFNGGAKFRSLLVNSSSPTAAPQQGSVVAADQIMDLQMIEDEFMLQNYAQLTQFALERDETKFRVYLRRATYTHRATNLLSKVFPVDIFRYGRRETSGHGLLPRTEVRTPADKETTCCDEVFEKLLKLDPSLIALAENIFDHNTFRTHITALCTGPAASGNPEDELSQMGISAGVIQRTQKMSKRVKQFRFGTLDEITLLDFARVRREDLFSKWLDLAQDRKKVNWDTVLFPEDLDHALGKFGFRSIFLDEFDSKNAASSITGALGGNTTTTTSAPAGTSSSLPAAETPEAPTNAIALPLRQLLRLSGPAARIFAKEAKFWVLSDAADLQFRSAKMQQFVQNPSTSFVQVLELLQELAVVPDKKEEMLSSSYTGGTSKGKGKNGDQGNAAFQVAPMQNIPGAATAANSMITPNSGSDPESSDKDKNDEAKQAANATLLESLVIASLQTDSAAHVVSFLLSPRMLRNPQTQRIAATVLRALGTRLTKQQMLMLCEHLLQKPRKPCLKMLLHKQILRIVMDQVENPVNFAEGKKAADILLKEFKEISEKPWKTQNFKTKQEFWSFNYRKLVELNEQLFALGNINTTSSRTAAAFGFFAKQEAKVIQKNIQTYGVLDVKKLQFQQVQDKSVVKEMKDKVKERNDLLSKFAGILDRTKDMQNLILERVTASVMLVNVRNLDEETREDQLQSTNRGNSKTNTTPPPTTSGSSADASIADMQQACYWKILDYTAENSCFFDCDVLASIFLAPLAFETDLIGKVTRMKMKKVFQSHRQQSHPLHKNSTSAADEANAFAYGTKYKVGRSKIFQSFFTTTGLTLAAADFSLEGAPSPSYTSHNNSLTHYSRGSSVSKALVCYGRCKIPTELLELIVDYTEDAFELDVEKEQQALSLVSKDVLTTTTVPGRAATAAEQEQQLFAFHEDEFKQRQAVKEMQVLRGLAKQVKKENNRGGSCNSNSAVEQLQEDNYLQKDWPNLEKGVAMLERLKASLLKSSCASTTGASSTSPTTSTTHSPSTPIRSLLRQSIDSVRKDADKVLVTDGNDALLKLVEMRLDALKCQKVFLDDKDAVDEELLQEGIGITSSSKQANTVQQRAELEMGGSMELSELPYLKNVMNLIREFSTKAETAYRSTTGTPVSMQAAASASTGSVGVLAPSSDQEQAPSYSYVEKQHLFHRTIHYAYYLQLAEILKCILLGRMLLEGVLRMKQLASTWELNFAKTKNNSSGDRGGKKQIGTVIHAKNNAFVDSVAHSVVSSSLGIWESTMRGFLEKNRSGGVVAMEVDESSAGVGLLGGNTSAATTAHLDVLDSLRNQLGSSLHTLLHTPFLEAVQIEHVVTQTQNSTTATPSTIHPQIRLTKKDFSTLHLSLLSGCLYEFSPQHLFGFSYMHEQTIAGLLLNSLKQSKELRLFAHHANTDTTTTGGGNRDPLGLFAMVAGMIVDEAKEEGRTKGDTKHKVPWKQVLKP